MQHVQPGTYYQDINSSMEGRESLKIQVREIKLDLQADPAIGRGTQHATQHDMCNHMALCATCNFLRIQALQLVDLRIWDTSSDALFRYSAIQLFVLSCYLLLFVSGAAPALDEDYSTTP